MGWFDNEQDGQTPSTEAPLSAPVRTVAKPAPTSAPESGSTLGRQIHVDGTIVCDEDLTILGQVEGTIRAKGTLVIAKEADVHAKIDGQRVLVHGKVDGNVHGAERVVLGQTARLAGNIEAPSLEIIEGAYFKGNVEMKPEKPAEVASGKPKAAKDEVETSDGQSKAGKETVEDAKTTDTKPVAGTTTEKTSAAGKQATP